ncbi:MAG: hypothetical protein ABI626_03520 [Sphingomicrobium sp.]
MRAKLIFTAAAMAIVAACGQSQPTQPKQPIVVRSDAQDALHKLDDMNRAIALKRALYDSGYRCQRVERSGFVTTYKNLDMWTAHCADGVDWAIFTGPDGSAQVRDCKDVAQFGMPACVIKTTG